METKIAFYGVINPNKEIDARLATDAAQYGTFDDIKLLGKFSFKGSHLNVVEAIRDKVDELAKKLKEPFEAVKAVVISYSYSKPEFQTLVSQMASEAF